MEFKRWKIWMKYFDVDGNVVGYGVHPHDYTCKYSAVRRAKQLWGNNRQVEWRVATENPWPKVTCWIAKEVRK